MKKQTTLDKMGQKLALVEINIHRVKAGKKPATRVTKLWWQIYGNEYRAKASAIASTFGAHSNNVEGKEAR